MDNPVSVEDDLKRQIEAEKAEIAVLEAKMKDLNRSFQKDASALKEQLSDQHETLRKIVLYAKNLEDQLKILRENVDTMKNLHRHSIH